MLKQNRYSTIRREPPNKSPHTLTGIYDVIISPGSLFAILAGIIALLGTSLVDKGPRFTDGEPEALIFFTLVALMLVVDYRIMQSLFLAKRDYSNIDSGLGDVAVFIAVAAVFIGTTTVLAFKTPLWALLWFAGLALAGFINFFRLWKVRLTRDEKSIEYRIERRIQCVNTLVCLYSALVMGALGWQYHELGPQPVSVMIGVGTVIVAFLFNIFHSHQLTLLPKFLLKNDPDDPSELASVFRGIYWRTAEGMSKHDILQLIPKEAQGTFRSIETVRAEARDVPALVDGLEQHFPYIFTRIFGTRDPQTLRRALTLLLTAGGGLGPMGYMHFYMLKQERRHVGFIKIEMARSCWLYGAVAALQTLFGLRKIFGARELWQIRLRWKDFSASQPGPQGKEVRLTYILILPAHQRKANGTAVVRMLINALLRDVTNDLQPSCITLFVRQSNPALRLFEAAGFTPADLSEPLPPDPYANDPAVGPASFLEFLRKDA